MTDTHVEDLINKLRGLKLLIKHNELNARDRYAAKNLIDSVIYELEFQFNPGEGIWRVENRRGTHRQTRILELAELPVIDRETLVKLESRRDECLRALQQAIEKTRQKSGRQPFWTVDPGSIISEVFRAVAAKDNVDTF